MKRAIILLAVMAAGLAGAQMFAQMFGQTSTGTPISALAWYRLDGNALDSSGNGYHGMWTGTESYTNGHSTGVVAGHFDGLSSIALGSISITNSSVTIMAWIKPSAINKDFLTLRTSFYRYAGTSAIRIYRGNGSFGYNVTGFNLPFNEYNHVAISLHPEEGAIGYQNGKIVGTSAETQGIGDALSFIAKSNASTYSGGLSDVRIYNCVLSESNIVRIMTGHDVAPIEELQ